MNSCAASCCTCSPKVSCASGTSASWPIAGVPQPCHSVFSCSVQRHNHKPHSRLPPPVPTIFGFAPSAAGPWQPSRDSPLPRFSFVLHLSRSRWPHETTINITQSLRVSARAISLCLAVLQTSTFRLLQPWLHGRLTLYPTQRHRALPSALCRTAPAHLDTTAPLHSIPIAPASAARAASFKSLYRKRANSPCSCDHLRLRASDTALGLHGTWLDLCYKNRRYTRIVPEGCHLHHA